jgi:hypothetical protein
MKWLMTTMLGLVLLGGASGCLVVAAGAATGVGVAYVKGDLEAVVDAPVERATEASKQACEEMGLILISSSSDALMGVVEARRADDTRVKITIRPMGEQSSKLFIRIGTFGNKAESMAIYDKIKAALQ